MGFRGPKAHGDRPIEQVRACSSSRTTDTRGGWRGNSRSFFLQNYVSFTGGLVRQTLSKIRNLGSGVYASLRAGKYDVDDTHRLESFDSTLGPVGSLRPLTPLEDITG